MPTQNQPYVSRQEAVERLESIYLSDVHRIAIRRFEQLAPTARKGVFEEFMETEVGRTLPSEHSKKGMILVDQPILKACLSIYLTERWDLGNYLEFEFWMESNGLTINELPDGGAWIFKNTRPYFLD